MSEDPLYHSIIESTHILTKVLVRLETTQRGLVRLQFLALAFLGLALLGLMALVWMGISQGQAHAAHTQALLDLLQRLPRP